MEPEANSLEIALYSNNASSRTFVDLSNYYQFWMSTAAGSSATVAMIYVQEVGGEMFGLGVPPAASSGTVFLNSEGATWITGYAALYIQFDQATDFAILGVRRT